MKTDEFNFQMWSNIQKMKWLYIAIWHSSSSRPPQLQKHSQPHRPRLHPGPGGIRARPGRPGSVQRAGPGDLRSSQAQVFSRGAETAADDQESSQGLHPRRPEGNLELVLIKTNSSAVSASSRLMWLDCNSSCWRCSYWMRPSHVVLNVCEAVLLDSTGTFEYKWNEGNDQPEKCFMNVFSSVWTSERCNKVQIQHFPLKGFVGVLRWRKWSPASGVGFWRQIEPLLLRTVGSPDICSPIGCVLRFKRLISPWVQEAMMEEFRPGGFGLLICWNEKWIRLWLWASRPLDTDWRQQGFLLPHHNTTHL